MDSNATPAASSGFSQYDKQEQSPLFNVLPSEIRHEIFAYALTSVPESTGPLSTRPLGVDEYCSRPGYETRHRISTELLRSCKRVYMEARHMPFAFSEHALYLTWEERSPRHKMSIKRMQECLDMFHHHHGDIRAGHIRIFAQLCALENRRNLMRLFGMRHFYPKTITITIRYTDTWGWEDNEPLRIDGNWGECMRLPASVSKFTLELESLERRKDEVDYIARRAADEWQFRRTDNVSMLADSSQISVSRWTGCSVLGGRRWVRDEARPGQLDYYLAKTTWRPLQESRPAPPGGNPSLAVKWKRQMPRSLGYEFIFNSELEELGIPLSTPAEKAVAEYAAATVQERSLVIV